MDLEAIEFLDELREQGGLPGFLKAEYCVLAAPDASDRGGSTLNLSSPYPVSRTFSAAKSKLHPKWDLLRGDPRFDRLPLLALSSLSSDKDRNAALAAGFDAYEVKLDRHSFLTAVRKLLTEGRPTALAPRGSSHD